MWQRYKILVIQQNIVTLQRRRIYLSYFPRIRQMSMDKTDSHKELETLRREIDATDDALWELILKRQQTARQIGVWKKQHHVPVIQKERFLEMLQARKQWGSERGLSEQTVERLMNALHEVSVMEQEKVSVQDESL